MAQPATADPRARAVFVAVVLVMTALGWAILYWLTPGYLAPLCGISAAGFVSLGGLVVMWSIMVVTMMLPATLPLTADRLPRDALGVATGYLAVALVSAWAAALTEWMLRVLSWIPASTPSTGVQVVLIAIAALGLLRNTPHRPTTGSGRGAGFAAGRADLGACIAMVALQLAFGSMDLLLMAVLALWMLAGAMIPVRALQAARI